MGHKYTDKQVEFIKKNVKGITNKYLTELFNKKFNTNLKLQQIKSFKANRGLKSELDCRFKKGNIPVNKGKKGLCGANRTSFKKGNKSYNRVPIGSKRITKDGYIQIKIQDGKLQNNWKGKHIIIWEKHNGPLPKGHAIIFGDGNKRNFNIDNLILVSRYQLLLLNQHNLIKNDTNLTKVAVNIVDLEIKIKERSKR